MITFRNHTISIDQLIAIGTGTTIVLTVTVFTPWNFTVSSISLILTSEIDGDQIARAAKLTHCSIEPHLALIAQRHIGFALSLLYIVAVCTSGTLVWPITHEAVF